MTDRQSTGSPGLDEALGGGLIPGTLTVVAGATGIGKTQFGIQYLGAESKDGGRAAGERPQKGGIIFDVCARGDSQNHAGYAERISDWQLADVDASQQVTLDDFFAQNRCHGDYLHVFDYRGQRVTKRDLDWEQWRSWQAELNYKLRHAIAFLYGNFVQGVQRVVIDGIEPADIPQESIQLNLCEYVYHQVLRKDPDWVARDLFRERFRQNQTEIEAAQYDQSKIGCVMLYTSHETMLEDLIARPLDEGDTLSNANTLIFMGKVRDGMKVRRALYIAKHRGSACSEDIIPYEINDQGLVIGS